MIWNLSKVYGGIELESKEYSNNICDISCRIIRNQCSTVKDIIELCRTYFMVKDTIELQHTHEHELSVHWHVHYA